MLLAIWLSDNVLGVGVMYLAWCGLILLAGVALLSLILLAFRRTARFVHTAARVSVGFGIVLALLLIIGVWPDVPLTRLSHHSLMDLWGTIGLSLLPAIIAWLAGTLSKRTLQRRPDLTV